MEYKIYAYGMCDPHKVRNGAKFLCKTLAGKIS